MYKNELALLGMKNLISYDRIAQRALLLRMNLRRLVDFARHDQVALQGIANGAMQANAMLVVCHREREYEFVHLRLFQQSTGNCKSTVFDDLPEVDGSLPIEQLEHIIGELEQWPRQIREAHNLPTAIIVGGTFGVTILRGAQAEMAFAHLQHDVANSNAA